ncbi:MAG: superoxide dismutase, Ni, partial [Candidatus Heimdallarchaeota archaeon]|nr:superoxide dismutase, Ni [Candidatus Heimdallarchaeota archaeon]
MIVANIIKKIFKVETVFAHCDIPCGIYTPHQAQVGAHTVVRMVDLMAALDKSDAEYEVKMARYIAVKEESAEIVKHEVRIIWGDFMKAENTSAYPDINDKVWKIMKLGGAAKQTSSKDNATALLAAVLEFSEIF